jgi:hypothetical protein
MPKAAVEVKRSTVVRLIRAAHDAGLKVTGVRVIGPEIKIETGPQDSSSKGAEETVVL